MNEAKMPSQRIFSHNPNAATANPPTRPDDIYKRSNLTRLQLLFWVGQRLRPEVPLFNTVHTFTISTEVNYDHFQKAFQALLDHSDALRTVFEEKEGVPQQRVVPNFSYQVDYVDLSQALDPQAAFQKWLEKRCVIPLNLEICLFDSALVKISSNHFVWYINQHHIVMDASSVFVTFERLAEFYQRSLTEATMAIAGLPAFMDYVDYERAYRNSPQFTKAGAYWERKLTPGPEPTRFYGQLTGKKTSQVQRISYDLGVERSQRIRQAAAQKANFTISEELSLYNIFAALFYAQLHLASGNHRLGILTPVHNRFNPAFRNTIGLLMEYCPLQVEVSAEDSFRSLIAKVRRETRETFAYYQYGSGLSLQDQIFDVIFNMYQVPSLQLNGAAVQVERIHPGYGSERLTLHVNDFTLTGNFVLHFDCHCDVFSEEQREQMVCDFVRLVDIFLEDDAQSINNITLLRGDNNSLIRNQAVTQQMLGASIRGQKLLEREAVLPRDDLERQLIQIWEQVLDVHPINVRDNFFDLGGSSWLAVRLFSEIEKAIGTTLPLRILLELATVEELAEILREQSDSGPWSPLVPVQSGGARQPFFCVHGAGGHILLFENIVRHLGSDQPFFAFQARGTEQGQEPFTYIEDMAAYYVKTLRDAYPDGPYLLGGYSMGGMVAFEMAQQLQAQGQKVTGLVIIDVPAQSPYFKYLRQFAAHLGALLRMSSDEQIQLFLRLRHYLFRLRYFSRLSTSDRVAYIRRKIAGIGSRLAKANSRHVETQPANIIRTSEDIDSYTLARRRIQSIYALNERAYRAYIPQQYQGRVMLIRSSKGYTGDSDKDYSPDPQIGWGKIVAGDIETYIVPGDHNEIIREPQVEVLAKQLRTCLDNAQRSSDSSSITLDTSRL